VIRLECLDGLRGILALYVPVDHAAPFAAIPARVARPLSHGGAAVDGRTAMRRGSPRRGCLARSPAAAGRLLAARVD